MTQNTIPTQEVENLLKFFPKGVIAFDLETTGLSPLIDKIIEIAAVKVTPSGIEVFEELINPHIPIPPYTEDIHGISNEMVADKEGIEAVLPRFLEFIEELPLIAHNAKFDLGFIIFQMHQLKMSVGKNKAYCSVQQARRCIDEAENYKLNTLAEFLKIDLLNHHRATDDAIASLRIFAHCLSTGNCKKLIHHYDFADYSQDGVIDLPENLELLYQKLPGQEEVLIKYKGGSMRNKWRVVKPVSVLPMPQGSILYAKCLHSELYKSFSLKKVTDVKEATLNEIEEILKNEKLLK